MTPMNRHVFSPSSSEKKTAPTECSHCLYFRREEEDNRFHCFRFARFVDHVLPERTAVCDYWTHQDSRSEGN